ncbi:ATP-binding cassette domain-containing protein [Halomonas piscis]|uniref:ATP-binding cassette domain-containing protein n=1 Tax=Halomonas piscis TaxID=3031727 RepID=A0ABY9Z0C5_9GAMM|nr:ATP-binding cassette domain-containing protein [Halomonas piscis]WNK20565.1 ATP-binding cassette domain-containing protein [Halomonas piscis]
MAQESALRLDNLHLAQGQRSVLEGVSGVIADGAVTALIGANGAGKSTLIKALMGELRPFAGKVHCTVPRARRAWLPQQLALDLSFPMSVEELVMTGTWPSHGALKGYCAAHYRRGREIMARLGISGVAHRPLGELSGGQRQRALIGRTLMQEAKLLLLDEPFANVDGETVDILIPIVRRMADDGATVIVVLHDMEHLKRLADSVLLLRDGGGEWLSPDAIAAPTASAHLSAGVSHD